MGLQAAERIAPGLEGSSTGQIVLVEVTGGKAKGYKNIRSSKR